MTDLVTFTCRPFVVQVGDPVNCPRSCPWRRWRCRLGTRGQKGDQQTSVTFMLGKYLGFADLPFVRVLAIFGTGSYEDHLQDLQDAPCFGRIGLMSRFRLRFLLIIHPGASGAFASICPQPRQGFAPGILFIGPPQQPRFQFFKQTMGRCIESFGHEGGIHPLTSITRDLGIAAKGTRTSTLGRVGPDR